MKHVEVGPQGARLGYVELEADRGDHRPTLVYLHGLGSCSPAYFAQSAAHPLLRGRHVLMIDLLGFGLSDRPSDFGYRLGDHADAVARGLDLLGVAGADVIGHSMGGGIAVTLASRRPELVGRLLLAEPSLRRSHRPRAEPYTEEEFVEQGFALALEAAGPQWAATMRLADPVAQYRSEMALGPTMEPLGATLLGLPMPRAVVEGDRTGWLYDDPALAEAGIRVHVMTDAGHTMMLDHPGAFARVVAEAFDAMGPPSATEHPGR